MGTLNLLLRCTVAVLGEAEDGIVVLPLCREER